MLRTAREESTTCHTQLEKRVQHDNMLHTTREESTTCYAQPERKAQHVTHS